MRKNALARFLNCPANQIFNGEYGTNSFTNLYEDYLVLSESEANEEAKKQVWSYIPTFDTDFLIKHLAKPIPKEEIKELLSNHCDNCLLIIASLIVDYEQFAQEAIEIYGRAYFICFKDKTEYKLKYGGKEYFIYRMI